MQNARVSRRVVAAKDFIYLFMSSFDCMLLASRRVSRHVSTARKCDIVSRPPETTRVSSRIRIASMLLCTSLVVCATGSVAQATGEPRSIALLNCSLIDDNAAYNDADTTRVQQTRIGMISDQLRDELRERGLYRVADNAPAADMIASLQSTQDLNACNGCEREVGRKLNVDRVGVCWVQKISNLILNINLRVEDVTNGTTVFQRSVDIRGNTDLSWQRGVKSLVDLLAAEGQ
jgi:hypothetical protein